MRTEAPRATDVVERVQLTKRIDPLNGELRLAVKAQGPREPFPAKTRRHLSARLILQQGETPKLKGSGIIWCCRFPNGKVLLLSPSLNYGQQHH
jgi:hypothetical protein